MRRLGKERHGKETGEKKEGGDDMGGCICLCEEREEEGDGTYVGGEK